MSTVRSKDGTIIELTTSGRGPLVVLVGGALQHKSDQVTARLSGALAGQFTVVSYDRRGRGGSGDTPPYAVEREIEDLDAVIRNFGSDAAVFGNSSGGILALLAAARLRNISRVAVYEAPFIAMSDAAAYEAQLRTLIDARQNGKAVTLFLERIGVPAPFRAIMHVMPMWSGLKALAPTLAYDARIVGDGAVPPELRQVAVPALLLTGTDARMQAAAARVREVVPSARVSVLEGQKHNVDPRVLAAALSEFFTNGRTQ